MMKRFVVLVWLVPAILWGWGETIAKQNRTAIATLQQRIQAQQERIDGLVSVIEGLNEAVGRLKNNDKNKEQSQNSALLLRIEALERRIVLLEDRLKKYEKPSGTFSIQSKATQLSSSKQYAKAVRAYKKRAYETAQMLFRQLLKEHYKIAASHFYLGEIAYYTKRYSDAIYHYKKSAEANDKAGYMDVLMLHTAVSLDKTGKKEQARAFYQAVIKSYPKRKSALIAKRRLGRMQ